MIEPLEERLTGRYTKKSVNIWNRRSRWSRYAITEDIARDIVNAGVEAVTIRSVFTCNTRHGVCRPVMWRLRWCGWSWWRVGTVLPNPGTQLIKRTFHTGGVASSTDITQGLPRVQIFEAAIEKGKRSSLGGKSQLKKIYTDQKVVSCSDGATGEALLSLFSPRESKWIKSLVVRHLTRGSIERTSPCRSWCLVGYLPCGSTKSIPVQPRGEIGDKHIRSNGASNDSRFALWIQEIQTFSWVPSWISQTLQMPTVMWLFLRWGSCDDSSPVLIRNHQSFSWNQ